MLVLAATRGLWFDEFWTIFLSRHAAPAGELLRTRWGPDVHPPFYTIYTWLLEPITGDSKLAMRLTNLLGLVFVAAGCLLVSAKVGQKRFLAFFLLLLVSSPFFLTYFGEYRSYFLECCGATFVILLLHALHFLDRDIAARSDRSLIAGAVIGIPLATMLHFTSGAEILIFCGIAFLYQCYRRHLGAALLLAVSMAIGVMLLAGSLALVMHFHPQGPPNNTSAVKGLGMAIAMMGLAMCANIVAAVVGLLVWWRGPAPDTSAERSYLVLMLVTLVSVVLVIAGLNAVKPFLAMRYMIAFVPAGSAPVAWLAARSQLRLAIPLVAANAAVLIAGITFQQSHNRRWETYTRQIRDAVAACPQTQVIALYTPPLLPAAGAMQAGIKNDRTVFMGGYQFLARAYGFTVAEAPATDGSGFAMRKDCPTLLWVEQNVYAFNAPATHMIEVAGVKMLPGTKIGEQRGPFNELFTLTPPGVPEPASPSR